MTGLALTLVLAAAFMHATWNLLLKRAGGGVAFTWLFCAVAAVLYTPAALGELWWRRPEMGITALVFIGGSAVLHIAYFLLLQRGYKVGDLSLVYPLARGTGPLLSTAAAVALFAERPTVWALGGVLLIALGVFVLTSGPRNHSYAAKAALGYGLITGVFIASYTIWDKYSVSSLGIPPLFYDWAANLVRTLLLLPFAVRQWQQVRDGWRNHRVEVLGIALFSPLAYILVLIALTFTPVSYVAPAREISILIGTAMGSRLLAEGQVYRRLAGAGAMVLGVVALALN